MGKQGASPRKEGVSLLRGKTKELSKGAGKEGKIMLKKSKKVYGRRRTGRA